MQAIHNKSIAARHRSSGYESLKKKVYDLLDPHIDLGWARVVNIVIITLIVLNTLAVILESVDEFNARYHYLIRIFDVFSVVVFSLEYMLRLWSCTINPKYKHSFYGRLKYMVSPAALIT